MWLMIAGILGFLAVGLGAYADHGLKPNLSHEVYATLMTGLKYHQIHTNVLLITSFAMLLTNTLPKNLLNYTNGLLLLGIILFSGNIYFYALTGFKKLHFLIPIGGVIFLIAWLMLAWIGFKTLNH